MANRILLVTALLMIGCGSRTIDDGYLDDWRADGGETDSAVVVTDTASINVDTATVEPSRTIRCGSAECNAATQDCCLGPGGGTCAGRGACMRGASLSCSSAASCPSGNVCCFRFSGMSGKSTCDSTCSGRGSFQLCDSDSECSGGTRCRDGMLVPGVKTCR